MEELYDSFTRRGLLFIPFHLPHSIQTKDPSGLRVRFYLNARVLHVTPPGPHLRTLLTSGVLFVVVGSGVPRRSLETPVLPGNLNKRV